MNQISEDKRTLILYLLGNGESARSAARIANVNKNTVASVLKGTVEKQDHRKELGRPPLGDKARSNIVQVRMSEDEYRKMLEQSKREGCKSLSEWIRRTLTREAKRILNEKADH